MYNPMFDFQVIIPIEYPRSHTRSFSKFYTLSISCANDNNLKIDCSICHLIIDVRCRFIRKLLNENLSFKIFFWDRRINVTLLTWRWQSGLIKSNFGSTCAGGCGGWKNFPAMGYGGTSARPAGRPAGPDIFRSVPTSIPTSVPPHLLY